MCLTASDPAFHNAGIPLGAKQIQGRRSSTYVFSSDGGNLGQQGAGFRYSPTSLAAFDDIERQGGNCDGRLALGCDSRWRFIWDWNWEAEGASPFLVGGFQW